MIDGLKARIELVERRLRRERDARKEAERLISDKSRELYQARQRIESALALLQLALDKTGEHIWQWHEQDACFGPALPGAPVSQFPWAGHEADFITRLYPEDADLFAENWEDFKAGRIALIDQDLRFMSDDEAWRWYRMRAVSVEADGEGRVLHAIGILLDVTDGRDPVEPL